MKSKMNAKAAAAASVPATNKGRQWHHRDSADGECGSDCDIGDGRNGKPEAWTNAP
jgi:hypothetical protein